MLVLFVGLGGGRAHAMEQLCDSSYEDCRNQLINLIKPNRWTSTSASGSWRTRATRTPSRQVECRRSGPHPGRSARESHLSGQRQTLTRLPNAGIPMRNAPPRDPALEDDAVRRPEHRRIRLGQLQPDRIRSDAPYSNYEDESIYFTDDPSIVNSFMTKFDDPGRHDQLCELRECHVTLTRSYPTYPIDPELNFPPGQDYATAPEAYDAETQKIDVEMFRITDERHTQRDDRGARSAACRCG